MVIFLKIYIVRAMKKIYFQLHLPKTIGRLFIPFIIVPLIAGIILSFIIFTTTSSQLKNTGDLKVNNFYTQANSILNEIVITNNSLINNNSFIRSVLNTEATREDTDNIITTLSKQKNNNAYVKDIYVICHDHDAIYGANSVYDDRSRIFDNFDYDRMDSLTDGWDVPNNSYADPYYVSIIKDDDNSVKATIITFLNKSYLIRTVFNMDSDFCCMYNESFILTSRLQSNHNLDYTSEQAIGKALGKPVSIFSKSSKDYTYMIALAKDNFYRPLYAIIISFSAYLLLILLFGVLYSLSINRMEKKLYSGIIDELPQYQSDNPNIQNIFSAITDALTKYKEERSALSEQKKFQDLNKLVHGNLIINSSENELARIINFDEGETNYYVMNFRIINCGIVDPSNRLDILSIIMEQTINSFSENRLKSICFPVDTNTDICSIISYKKDQVTQSFIYETIEHAFRLFETNYGSTFICTVSKPVYAFQDIPAAFQSAVGLFRFMKAINSTSKIVMEEQLAEYPGILLDGEFLKQIQILANTLLLGKFEMIPQMVDNILDEHVAPIRKDYDLVQERLDCIVTLLCSAPFPSRITDDEKNEIFTDLKNASSVSELSHTVHQSFRRSLNTKMILHTLQKHVNSLKKM